MMNMVENLQEKIEMKHQIGYIHKQYGNFMEVYNINIRSKKHNQTHTHTHTNSQTTPQ